MDKSISDYISRQPEERQSLLKSIHEIIVKNDKSAVPVIEPMMGKEMIIYKVKGTMKYGLSSVKNYISLHALPIYGSPQLHTKYRSLLNKAEFQKGCINFQTKDQMPPAIVKQFIKDCSAIDLVAIREKYLAEKKKKKTKS